MKWVFLAIGITFAGFAVVQLNDPDPVRWFVAYGLVAVAGFAAALRRCPLWLATAACLVSIGASAYRFPSIGQIREGSLSMRHPDSISDEEVREAGGLLLAAAASLYVLIRVRRDVAAPQREGGPSPVEGKP